jgi:hypothetical protein
MEDALGPIGAGIVGLSIYVILKAMWWAGEYEDVVPPPPVAPRPIPPLKKRKRWED